MISNEWTASNNSSLCDITMREGKLTVNFDVNICDTVETLRLVADGDQVVVYRLDEEGEMQRDQVILGLAASALTALMCRVARDVRGYIVQRNTKAKRCCYSGDALAEGWSSRFR